MTKEEAQRRMQELLTELHSIVSVMNDVAQIGKIEYVDFMGQMLKFGIKKGHTWEDIDTPNHHYKVPEARELEFITAVSGPHLGNEHWQYSSFRCWPDPKAKEWLFGDGPDLIRSSYDEENDEDDEIEPYPSLLNE